MSQDSDLEMKIYEKHAALCQTLASPVRLRILYSLMEEERSVNELVRLLGIPQANISQHLAILRERGVVATRREGVNIYYKIANPRITKACSLIREVLFEQMATTGQMAKQYGKLAK